MKVLIRNHQRLIRINLRKIKKDSLRLLRLFTLDRAELGVILAGDTRIKHLNASYRGVNDTTDVLSFPIYNARGEIPTDRHFLLGDIVINPVAAKRQSSLYGAPLDKEMQRLLIHGFLHLLGYDHEKNKYQAKKMKKEERRLQHALETMD